MKKFSAVFILLTIVIHNKSIAQNAIPSPRPNQNIVPALPNAEAPQTPVEIHIAPPSVINFQQLADSELVNPPKKKEGFIEQEEDRDADFSFHGLPVPADAIIQTIPVYNGPVRQRNSPAPTGTWDGIVQSQSLIPPDIRGAASVGNFVMETTNQHFKIYNKTGTLLSTLSITTFFNSTGGNGYFDPHVIYDHTNNRFIVCIDGNASNGNSGLFVGVSQTSDPTGSWYIYGFDAIGNSNDFLDYPLLGVNTNWVVITGNDFLGNGGNSSKIYVLNRASLYAGALGTVSTFTDNNLFTIAPAQTFDTAQTTEYLVADYNGNSGGNGYVKIGSITAGPIYNAGTTLGTNQTWSENSVGALQLGSTHSLEDGDTRIGNAVYINGSLWFTHTAFLPASNPTHDGVDWWQVNPATPAIQQFGRIEDTNGPKFFFYPSIAVNTNGDALLGYCESSSSMYAGAAYSFHASTDAANTMQTTYLYKAGTAGYYQTLGGGRNRWGDFTGTAVDPFDNSLWGFGEWSAGSSTWGTEVVHVDASSTICTAHASFSYTNTVSCSAPLTVNFTNTSTSANTYVWYFGDGNTSTADNPSHTYTTLGNYTVKLVATSTGTCGTDSITISNLVNISPANPCIVIMPTTGTATTQTSCSGVIYDDGGLTGNYSDNSNSTLTISPTGASQVRLHFTQFRMENTYDFVYVYDGPSTASTQIGVFTGTTIPADVTSSGPSITIRQSSDANTNDAGYTINWSCILPNSPPVADLSADFTASCTGNIQFTDLTTGGANSWLWNFGDGTTSTLQNPSHVYLTNGTFTVTLTATNNFGSNMVTKTNYIVISKPAGPTVTSDSASSCVQKSFTLTAAGNSPVTWFNTAGVAVSTANPFVTPTLSSTTTYYVEDTVTGSNINVGPVNNAFGTGGYLNASWYLIFNVMKPCVLQSVYVYANGAGNRTFQLLDKANTVVATQTVNLPNGGSRVTLNFNLSIGDSFQLGLPTGSTINLYRNNAGATYPFTDADNNLSIIGNSASGVPNYYYYCYDWIIQEKCISLRSPATLIINPTITATISATNVSCFGGSNGSVTVTPLGGTPGFTYHWSNNGNTATISGVSGATYLITVTDAVGCSVQKSQTVSQPTAITTSATVTNVLCNGANTGAIILNVSGGTSGYTYNWGSGITTQNRTTLSAGNYNVTITDANSCTATSSSTVSQPTVISATSTVSNATCNSQNGSASVSASGGTPSYSYLWNSGQTTPSISNLAGGSYSVTVTDNHSCTASASATVGNSSSLTSSSSVTNATCNGSADGSATVTVNNATQPVTYLWSNSNNSNAINNVTAGIYSVTITDGNGCTSSLTENISQPSAISISNTSSATTCNLNNGTVLLNVSGGTGGYSYSWSNGESAALINSLSAGSYTVTVTDIHSCSATASASVTSTPSLSTSVAPVNVTCFGAANGSAAVNITNGVSPFSYSWSTGVNSSTINNLASGNYSVTVHDSNNCSSVSTFSVTEPTTLAATTTSVNVTCFGGADGSATVAVSGGVPSYTYQWCTATTTATANNLSAGNCVVTATDANGCTISATIVISQPGDIQFTTSVTDANGGNNGAVTVTTSGGIPPYSIQWPDGGNGTNLAAGTYSFTVTDANGCTKTGSAVVKGTTAVNEIQKELSFTVYPNPASNEVFVVLNNWKDKTYYSLKDVLGQALITKVITSPTTSIDLSPYASGIYMIEISHDGMKSAKKITVSK